jgi:multicomponent Na+:H+ antiporter subunit E
MAIEDEGMEIRYDPAQRQKTVAAEPSAGRSQFILTRLILFGLLFLLWLLLSGKFDLFHMTLGVISCALVTGVSGDLVLSGLIARDLWRIAVGFARFTPWLLYQIFLANIHILRLVFHPRMMERIDPHVFKFESRLKSDLGLVTFANSITLTPGTITVLVSGDGDFKVHAIDRASAEPLPGEMEERIAAALEERK